MAEYCDDGRYKIYRPPIWLATGKYRAKAGKNIAVGNTTNLTIVQKADLYKDKASNILFVKNSEEIDELSGPNHNIPKDRMIVGISPQDNLTYWTQLGIKRFNVDEPWHNKNVRCKTQYTPQWLRSAEDQLPADGKLYTSEFYHRACWSGWPHDDQGSTCEAPGAHNTINHLIAEYAPVVTAKSKLGTHSKWEYLDGTGVITDPRSQWTQLRDQLSGQGKFDHGWVPTVHHAYHIAGWGRYSASTEEMQLIFGHANNIAASTIFIYVENPDGQYSAGILDGALYAAFQAGGWVEREEEQVQAVFCCTTPTYDPDSCELFDLIHFGEFRWM